MHANTLTVADLDPLFAALRNEPGASVPAALKEVIALAKRGHMDADALQRTLESFGIEGTPEFHAWLKAQFEGSR